MDGDGFKSCRILVAGLGLIGGSSAKALRRAGYAHIDAFDADAVTLGQAEQEGAVDRGFTAIGEGEYDLVICCLPPRDIPALYESVKPHIKPGGVFAELGGLKKLVIKRLSGVLPPEHELLCLHTMAGSERTGYAASDASMFEGAQMILTPTAMTGSRALAWAQALKEALGCADMPRLSAEQHDEIIAGVSHLPHIAALAVKAANTGNEEFAGGSYKAITRVAEINAPLWAGLLTDNAEYLLQSMARFREGLDALQHAVETRDAAALEKLLKEMGTGERP